MRNLKRALSLTLASVMLLGMMVVGAGAAGFPDVTEEDNVEAIEVLQTVEVMIGDDNGNFGPNDPVNRSQMAVVMAKLLHLDYQYYEASCPFWDVPTWARGYVGACYANKIVSGYGDGTYGAADGVTPVQAASMMMRALGYFQHTEDYKDGFETATVRQGTEIGIFKGVSSSANAEMTRNQVAQMALNALCSEMVNFTGTPGTTYTTSTGESLSIGYVAKYESRTSTELKYKAIEDRTSDASLDSNHRGQYYIQLGEELFDGKLVRSYDYDVFMRPSINWQYNGKEIGTYVNYELKKAEYLTGVKYSKLYEDLTYTTINNNDIARYVDGAVVSSETKDNFYRANDATAFGTGTGALTEVFLDDRTDLITITTINTYLAQANSDYNKTSDSVSLKVFDKRGGTTKVVDGSVVPQVADVEKDEYRLVYMSYKDRPAGEVVNMYGVEIMSDAEITKFSIDGSAATSKVVKKLTTGGTEYDTNQKAYYDGGNVLDEYNTQLLSDMSYNIYMDRYGNVIGVDLYEGAKNYVFITGYDRGISHISTRTADAAAIFMDGTMDVITVNVTDTNKNIDGLNSGNEHKHYDQYEVWSGDGKIAENRWYTYTVNASGVYTLRPVKNFMFSTFDPTTVTYGEAIRTLNTANLFLKDGALDSVTYVNKGNIYGNDDSIYLTVEAGRVDKSAAEDGSDADTPETNPTVPKPSDEKVNDAIVDIVGRYTGAQDVKIDLKADVKQEVNESKDAPEKDAYVYSIFDNNYYIIASVVLGEAQGAAANYVYVLDGVQNERVEHGSNSRSASDDTYYWEFKAVVDGEETTLTVKEKYDNTLNSLKNILKVHTIQEIRYDGEYVTAIRDVPLKDTFTNPSSEQTLEDMKIYDIGNEYGAGWRVDNADSNGFVHNNAYGSPNTALDSSDPNSGLYNGKRVEGDRIEVIRRTLYTNRNRGDVGLALANNAKAVVVQPVNGTVKVTNCGSVSEAVGMLADRYSNTPDKEFKGRVAAALDASGAAKWVVIISDTNLVTGDRPNYDYDGRTYTLTLRDILSNYNVSNTERAHVSTRANSSADWEPVEARGTGVYSDVYDIQSGYQVRIIDRDITSAGQIVGCLANDYATPIPGGITEYIARNEIQFTMPSANVELQEKVAYTYEFARFEIDLNQPVTYPLADGSLVEVRGYGERSVKRAAEFAVEMVVTDIDYAIEGGEIKVIVSWTYPTSNDEYDVADTYTTTAIATNAAGRDVKAEKVECEKGDAFTGEASTAELPGTVVIVGSVDEGQVTISMSNTEYADAKNYGFIVVDSEDETLVTGEIEEKDGVDTITVKAEDAGIENVTVNETEIEIGEDSTGTGTTETPEEPDPDEAIKAVVMTAVPADEVEAGDALTATTSTTGVTVSVEPTEVPAEVEEVEVTITVTTENEKGFAADVAVSGAEGWVMSTVAEGDKSFTLTKTLTVKEEGGSEVTKGELPLASKTNTTEITYYWYEADAAESATYPVSEAEISRLENEIKAAVEGATAVDLNLRFGNADVTTADGTTAYTLVSNRCFKVSLEDGSFVYAYGTKAIIDTDEAAAAFTGTGKQFVIVDPAKKAYDAAVTFAAPGNEGVSNITGVNFAVAKKDVTLVQAYKVTDTGNVIYESNTLGGTPFGSGGKYVADKTELTAKLTTTAANNIARISATVDGAPITVVQNVYAATGDYYVTFKIDAATMADDGVIALTHSAGVDLQYDGVSLGLVSAVPTSGVEIAATLAAGKNWGDKAFNVAYLGEELYIEDAATTKAVAVTYDMNSTVDTSDDKYTFTFSAQATAGLTGLDAADENGVIELSKVWKVTATDVTVAVGEDEPTMTSGILVKDGESVTVSTEADAAGKCIAVGGVVDTDAGLSTDAAVATGTYQISKTTAFTQLDGIKSITLDGVDALVAATGSTEVEAVDVNSNDGAFATASAQAATRQAEGEESATDVADTENEIQAGDEIVLTLTLTAADATHTLAFLEEIELDSISDASGYSITLAPVAETDAWTVTITFTAGE